MTETIQELEAKLAQAKAEEAVKEGFDIAVFKEEGEGLEIIKAEPKTLSPKDHAAVIASSKVISENMEDIEKIQEKIADDTATTQDWLALIFAVDEPIKVILSRYFGLDEARIASLPNLDMVVMIAQSEQFNALKVKSDRVAQEIQFIKNGK